MSAPALALDALAQRCGVFLCVECGKCSAVCPMADLYDDYRYEISPRGIIEHALLGLPFDDDGSVWSCLTCDTCTDLCPQGVKIRDYVVGVRETQMADGLHDHAAFCEKCHTYIAPNRNWRLVSDTSRALCVSCRRYDLAEKVRSL